MKQFLFFLTAFAVFSCTTKENNVIDVVPEVDTDSIERVEYMDSLDNASISDYDMSTVDKENSEEFMESLVKIEKEFGEQWDFCTCVLKNDSINKAFSSPVSDEEFDRLSDRFDVIESKCKAFLVQNPNVTPEERKAHEKKVRDCLKEAGVN